MKIVLTMALIALSFATGFTCSKNAPEQTQQQAVPADQGQMAAPVEGSATVPATETAAAPGEPMSQPATEGTK